MSETKKKSYAHQLIVYFYDDEEAYYKELERLAKSNVRKTRWYAKWLIIEHAKESLRQQAMYGASE